MPNHAVDRNAYAFKVMINIIICKAQDSKTESLKRTSSVVISFPNIIAKVSAAIQFNHQSGLGTVEINNIVIDGMLTSETNRICSKKFKP